MDCTHLSLLLAAEIAANLTVRYSTCTHLIVHIIRDEFDFLQHSCGNSLSEFVQLHLFKY